MARRHGAGRPARSQPQG